MIRNFWRGFIQISANVSLPLTELQKKSETSCGKKTKWLGLLGTDSGTAAYRPQTKSSLH
jgi:hypothetical protein